MKKLTNLTKAADIIEVLGGPDKLAELTEATDPAVWNWLHSFEAFPANTYALMIKELAKRGYTAPPHLWKMRGFQKPSKRRAA
jgi:hypothetical protein